MKTGETLSGQKKITTIIPHYNQPELLFDTIDSCIKQTYNNHRIYIIDDNSDNANIVPEEVFLKHKITPEFVDSRDGYSLVFHPKVCLLLSHKRSGPAQAKNFGIKLDYDNTDAFMFLYPGDRMKDNKIEVFVKMMEQDWDNIGVVYSDYLVDVGEERVYHEYREPYSLKGINEKCIIPSSSLVNRKVFDSIGLFDDSPEIATPHEFWRRMSQYRPHFQCVHTPEPYTIISKNKSKPTTCVPGNIWRHEVEV